ncbi:MAG: hypothetical protein IT460_14715 [Planctomycetes bacterium]|nr:hypothetical protein [Planctomycetota bacterium]
MTVARLVLAGVAALAAVAASAPRAHAEEIVLATGARYDATEVTVTRAPDGVGGEVRYSVVLGGGRATVTVPFDRLDPRSLFDLVLARTPGGDARGQLDLARFALARGLPVEAERRFRRAADLDPALAPDRDAGLAAIRLAQGEKALAAAEADLTRGRADLALARAGAVAKDAPAASPLAARAVALAELAARVADRDRKRAEAEAAAREAAALAAKRAAFDASLARADAAVEAGLKERGRAANPDLGATAALRALEAAEARLREARRLLAAAVPSAGDRLPEVTARDRDVLALLVATDLDLAELHRQRRAFERARDYLRAAQVLDPENPRIKDIRDHVEADLRTPVPVPPDAFDGWSTFTYAPGVVTTPYYTARRSGWCGCGPSGFVTGSWSHGRWFFRW